MLRLKPKWAARAAAVLLAFLPAANGAKAEDILVTQWGVTFSGAPFAVAIDQGFFKRAGLDITGVIGGTGGGTSVRNVLASGFGYGDVSLSSALAAILQGEDLKIVNLGARSIADSLAATMPDSPVRGLADLKGRKIGFTNPKSLTEMFAVMLADRAGLKTAEVERIALGSIGGSLTALERGSVDVAFPIEPVFSSRKGRYRLLVKISDVLPPMAQAVGVATGDLIRNRPDKLRALLDARRKAVDALYADPKAAAASIAKYYDRVKPEVVEEVVTMLAKDGFFSRGKFELDRMNNMQQGLRLVGALQGDIDWSKALDKSFLPKDLQD